MQISMELTVKVLPEPFHFIRRSRFVELLDVIMENT